ncbi:MAG: TolC family protein [Nitrospiria bacterium]
MNTLIRRLLLVLLFFIGLTAIAEAAEEAIFKPEQHKLRLEDAIHMALKQNPDLKMEKERRHVEAERLKQAKRFLKENPELSIDVDYRKRKFASPSGDSGTDFELRLLQEIEISGQREHRIETAEKYLDAARWRIAETERQLRLKVNRLFYGLQILQEKIDIQSQRLALQKSLFTAGQKRFQQEDISVLEIDTLRFDRDQAQQDLSKLKAEKLVIEQALRSSLGLEDGQEVVAVGALSPDLSQERKTPDALGELEACALKHRPDLKAMEAAREGDDAAFQLAKSSKVPNLALGPLFKSDNEDTVIGASLIIPLPFFNRNQEAVTEARVNLDVMQIALDAKEREIRAEVSAAHRGFLLAENQFNLYGEAYLKRLKERSTFPERAYRAGEIGIFEFSVAQGRLAEAQMRYLDALLALLKARAYLDAQLGACRSIER